jgi:MFS family permease
MKITRERLGLPDTRGRRRLLAAWLIDSLGTGMFLPFTVLYFVMTTTIPVSLIGLAMSLGSLLALPLPPVVGRLIDRWGPRVASVIGNVVEAIAFLGALRIGAAWQVAIFAAAVASGRVFFWMGNQALIAVAAEPDQRPRWFGLSNTIRNVGAGIGALLAGLAVAGGGSFGYHLIATINALSFVVSAFLVQTWRQPQDGRGDVVDGKHPPRPATKRMMQSATYARIVKDRPFLLLVGTSVILIISEMSLEVILVLYIARTLGLAAWWGGVAFTFLTLLSVIGQTSVVRIAEKRHPARALQTSALLLAVAFVCLSVLAILPTILLLAGLFIAISIHCVAILIEDPIVKDLVIRAAPPTSRGGYLAVYQYSWTLGEVLAPVSLTWLFAAGPVVPWVVLATACLFAIASGGIAARGIVSTRTSPDHAGKRDRSVARPDRARQVEEGMSSDHQEHERTTTRSEATHHRRVFAVRKKGA